MRRSTRPFVEGLYPVASAAGLTSMLQCMIKLMERTGTQPGSVEVQAKKRLAVSPRPCAAPRWSYDRHIRTCGARLARQGLPWCDNLRLGRGSPTPSQSTSHLQYYLCVRGGHEVYRRFGLLFPYHYCVSKQQRMNVSIRFYTTFSIAALMTSQPASDALHGFCISASLQYCVCDRSGLGAWIAKL